MKNLKKIFALLIVGSLAFVVINVRNDNKFEELNASMVALGNEEYVNDGRYVPFRTLNDMNNSIDETLDAYNTEIKAKQDELINTINTSESVSDLEYLIPEIEAVNNEVADQEQYVESIALLDGYANEIQIVENAANMAYFVEDTKAYMSENFTAQELETISIGFINLETKEELYFNEDFLFYSASTIKVPINMYVYDLIAQGSVSLDDTITYTEEYYDGGTGVMQYDPYGTIYTVDEILTQSIVSSDNVATNMLTHNYFEDPYNLTKELEQYWGSCNLDRSTSRECSVTNHIQSLNYLYDHSSEYEMLLQDMKDSLYKDMVPKYIDTEVANKVGMDGSIRIDDAIVYADTPYAISMAFVGIDNAEERMALLSEEIYTNWCEYMK